MGNQPCHSTLRLPGDDVSSAPDWGWRERQVQIQSACSDSLGAQLEFILAGTWKDLKNNNNN